MKKHLFLSIIVFIYIFNGCGQSAYSYFTHDKNYYKTLNNSQKGELRDNLVTKAIISGTYLNPIKDEYKNSNNEIFLIGLYIVDDFQTEEKQGLNNPFYSLTLNGSKASTVKELSKEDKLLKQTPLTDRWTTYYILSFPQSKDNSLTLELFHSEINKSLLLVYEKSPQK